MSLYELHITVHDKDIENFMIYCKINRLKPIYVVSPKMIKQLMFSKFTTGTEKECVDYAMLIKSDLIQNGFTVLRTKVELIRNNKSIYECVEHYFEYHISMDETDSIPDTPDTLECVTFSSKNILRINPKILLTLRVKGIYGSIYADSLLNKFMKGLQNKDYKIQYEIAVYDDNILLDQFISYTNYHRM